MPFQWHPDDPPPPVEEHSKAKLTVLRSYLRAYFDRLNVNPHREVFKLDLVDGFAGGGTFQDGDEIVSGTPLIMLEEAEAARERISRGRSKPLQFDCKHYFVDKETAHTAHLRRALTERGYQVDGEAIVVRNSRFEDEADGIIAEIRRRQPRSGRAIFLLDQTGFSQVELELVARIFRELPAAEIILTFAADALVNHLSMTPALIKSAAPLELTEARIHELIEYRDRDGGRALIQRVLRPHIRTVAGSTYDTPFFIRPRHSRRALWFLHLSRHPTARDVMIQRHWDVQNTFEHYGPGDFGMLGWDALQSAALPLFHFEDMEARQMREQLLDPMARELFGLASESPIAVDVMRHLLANRTAARFTDLDEVVLRLRQEREIEIRDAGGKVRSPTLTRLRPDDRIAVPETLLLPMPGISRLR
ncbi:MAG: three-Cys-motif partner protein TcmP [Chromatiales bacterium]|nr:three-Cys-motif partner protein TcmP [Chromatiales bacterium]